MIRNHLIEEMEANTASASTQAARTSMSITLAHQLAVEGKSGTQLMVTIDAMQELAIDNLTRVVSRTSW